jgi:divalent metal cation (Fe/Co/Zn/Cd) transporter
MQWLLQNSFLLFAKKGRYSQEGIRTVWLALAALMITSLLQIIIVVFSGSVALLADTVHNIGDALNSVPLLIAFLGNEAVALLQIRTGRKIGSAAFVGGIARRPAIITRLGIIA